jgi:phage gpG-like protein
MQLRITARNIEEVSAELRNIVRSVEDIRPVLAEFGIHMIRSVEKTFQTGGHPVPWPASIRARTRGGKTLIKSGRLKNSIVAALTGDRTLQVGTNVKYAAIHQLGFSGTVQIPEHIRRVTRAFGRRLKTPTYATVRGHPAHMRIPARPFLVAQEEDLEIWKGMLGRHMEGGK